MGNKKQYLKKTRKNITVSSQISILEALKRMDDLDGKLLMVIDGGIFQGLVSIGDIQRSIIKSIDLESPIRQILRKNIKVAKSGDSFSEIKKMMLKFRVEFMPVVNSNNEVTHVYHWEKVFGDQKTSFEEEFDIPVVIMAGGQGTRLKPITNIIPKPLVPIGEKPMVEVIMDGFHDLGVKEFFMSVNYKADMIQFYFDHLEAPKYNINYIKEDEPLGTAGSLSLIKDKLDSTFFVSNCDILIDQDFYEIYNYHKENKFQLTIVAALNHYKIPYGTIELGKNGVLTNLKEKPELTFMINTGMYILEPEVLQHVPDNEFFHMTELIDRIRKGTGTVGVFPVSEKSWMDIGQWADYQKTLNIFDGSIK